MNLTTQCLRTMADLLDEAAKVLDRVRKACPGYWEHFEQRYFLVDELEGSALLLRDATKPTDMILHCPACGLQHIDAPDFEDDPSMLAAGITHKAYDGWTNPPHRSHLCHGCSHVWRPADVATNGVAAIKTKGENDSPRVELGPAEIKARHRLLRDGWA